MAVSPTMFMTGQDEWETPDDLFNWLDNMFHFDRDVCASHTNHKHPVFFTKEDDALKQRWEGVCYMNPPYGRTIGQWTGKALLEAYLGATVVALLPARTDTKWWFDSVILANEIWFLKGRIKFIGLAQDGSRIAGVGAPYPSCIAVFQPHHLGHGPQVAFLEKP